MKRARAGAGPSTSTQNFPNLFILGSERRASIDDAVFLRECGLSGVESEWTVGEVHNLAMSFATHISSLLKTPSKTSFIRNQRGVVIYLNDNIITALLHLCVLACGEFFVSLPPSFPQNRRLSISSRVTCTPPHLLSHPSNFCLIYIAYVSPLIVTSSEIYSNEDQRLWLQQAFPHSFITSYNPQTDSFHILSRPKDLASSNFLSLEGRDLAYAMLTSGSTGEPKLVFVPNEVTF